MLLIHYLLWGSIRRMMSWLYYQRMGWNQIPIPTIIVSYLLLHLHLLLCRQHRHYCPSDAPAAASVATTSYPTLTLAYQYHHPWCCFAIIVLYIMLLLWVNPCRVRFITQLKVASNFDSNFSDIRKIFQGAYILLPARLPNSPSK